MKNKEKASAFITQRELEYVVGSLSIHEDGEWKEIANNNCKGNGCKKVSIDEAVDMAKVLQNNKMLLDNSVYFKLEIKKLKNEMEKETDRLLGVVRVHSNVVDELKEERNKLNDTIDKKDIDSKKDFEEIQKLKKSNRVGEVIIGFLTTSILIYTIYNLM